MEIIDTNSIIYGCSKKLHDKIKELSELFDVDEVILLDINDDSNVKMDTLELLGNEFNLCQ